MLSAPASISLTDHTALREWSATCADIEAGRQVLLIRKGGISEAGFDLEANRFLLLPTLFHQGETAPDSVEVRVLCELVAASLVPSATDITPLAPFHTYEPGQLATRVRYKPDRPLTLIAIRPFALVTPLTLSLNSVRPVCKSWLAVPGPRDLETRPIFTSSDPAALASVFSTLEGSIRFGF